MLPNRAFIFLLLPAMPMAWFGPFRFDKHKFNKRMERRCIRPRFGASHSAFLASRAFSCAMYSLSTRRRRAADNIDFQNPLTTTFSSYQPTEIWNSEFSIFNEKSDTGVLHGRFQRSPKSKKRNGKRRGRSQRNSMTASSSSRFEKPEPSKKNVNDVATTHGAQDSKTKVEPSTSKYDPSTTKPRKATRLETRETPSTPKPHEAPTFTQGADEPSTSRYDPSTTKRQKATSLETHDTPSTPKPHKAPVFTQQADEPAMTYQPKEDEKLGSNVVVDKKSGSGMKIEKAGMTLDPVGEKKEKSYHASNPKRQEKSGLFSKSKNTTPDITTAKTSHNNKWEKQKHDYDHVQGDQPKCREHNCRNNKKQPKCHGRYCRKNKKHPICRRRECRRNEKPVAEGNNSKPNRSSHPKNSPLLSAPKATIPNFSISSLYYWLYLLIGAPALFLVYWLRKCCCIGHSTKK